MTTVQRKRNAQLVTIYLSEVTTDTRGNKSLVADMTNSIPNVKVALMPKRGARAEVPGQAQINIMEMHVDHAVTGIDLWSRVLWNGTYWDVVSPPAFWNGTRHNRHWTLDIRRRP